MKRLRISILLLLLALVCSPSALAEPAKDAAGIVEERCFERNGQKIYGKLYLPEDAAYPLPLMILSHGLGSNHHKMEPYAERFAENGLAAYVFDYIGGSEESKSDGVMTEMSILTEAEDLCFILDRFGTDSRFERDRVFLFGGSQGGFVSSYVAGIRPEAVAGLIALYPAFNLQDICRELASGGDIPDSATIGSHTVGSVYIEDMLTFDIYDVMKQYTGPALLYHGTADKFVQVDYSRRALSALGDAELVIIEGAGHGFQGEDMTRVVVESLQFVERIINGEASYADAA